jgi:hypothetical protein
LSQALDFILQPIRDLQSARFREESESNRRWIKERIQRLEGIHERLTTSDLVGTAIDWTAYNDVLYNYCVWGTKYDSFDVGTGHDTGVSRSSQWSGVDYGRSIVNGCEGIVE